MSTILYFLMLGLSGSFSCTAQMGKVVLVGCTPGEDPIRTQLGIPKETVIDFIKWDLVLDTLNSRSFLLNIVYGESKPNTLGFKEGGQKKSYQGHFLVSINNGNEI